MIKHVLHQAITNLKKFIPGYEHKLALVEASFAEGKIDKAIQMLESALEEHPVSGGYIRLAEMRHNGFFKKPLAVSEGLWPPLAECSAYPENLIPEVQAISLTPECLGVGILGHGALIVRGLLNKEQTDLLVNAIDNAFAANDQHALTGSTSEWFSPLKPCAENGNVRIARQFIKDGGGTLAVDSPKALSQLVQVIKSTPAADAIAGYLKETPVLSAKKTTLRRVSPDSNSGWHQDGAFLGKGIRTVNLWIALTDCGTDAPSMDMIPKRLNSIIKTGGGDANFSWSLDNAAVAQATGNLNPVRLQFKAGDAIMFDELNLHRTAAEKQMKHNRYAIEAWFFAPSAYPLDQIPVLF